MSGRKKQQADDDLGEDDNFDDLLDNILDEGAADSSNGSPSAKRSGRGKAPVVDDWDASGSSEADDDGGDAMTASNRHDDADELDGALFAGMQSSVQQQRRSKRTDEAKRASAVSFDDDDDLLSGIDDAPARGRRKKQGDADDEDAESSRNALSALFGGDSRTSKAATIERSNPTAKKEFALDAKYKHPSHAGLGDSNADIGGYNPSAGSNMNASRRRGTSAKSVRFDSDASGADDWLSLTAPSKKRTQSAPNDQSTAKKVPSNTPSPQFSRRGDADGASVTRGRSPSPSKDDTLSSDVPTTTAEQPLSSATPSEALSSQTSSVTPTKRGTPTRSRSRISSEKADDDWLGLSSSSIRRSVGESEERGGSSTGGGGSALSWLLGDDSSQPSTATAAANTPARATSSPTSKSRSSTRRAVEIVEGSPSSSHLLTSPSPSPIRQLLDPSPRTDIARSVSAAADLSTFAHHRTAPTTPNLTPTSGAAVIPVVSPGNSQQFTSSLEAQQADLVRMTSLLQAQLQEKQHEAQLVALEQQRAIMQQQMQALQSTAAVASGENAPLGLSPGTPSLALPSPAPTSVMTTSAVDATKIHELSLKVRELELEVKHLRSMLDAAEERKKEEIDVVEKMYTLRLQKVEQMHSDSDLRLCRFSFTEMCLSREVSSLTEKLETQRYLSMQEQQESFEKCSRQRDELERKHQAALQSSITAHREELTRKDAERVEELRQVRELANAQIEQAVNIPQNSLVIGKLTQQLESNTKNLVELGTSVSEIHASGRSEQTMFRHLRDEQLSQLQSQSSRDRQEMERERRRMQDIISKLEIQLSEQSRLQDDERWQLKQEQNKLTVAQNALERERTSVTDKLERESARLNEARDMMMSEQRDVMSQLLNERAEQRAFRLEQGQARGGGSAHAHDSSAKSSDHANVSVWLEEAKARVLLEERRLGNDRNELEEERQKLKDAYAEFEAAKKRLKQDQNDVETAARLIHEKSQSLIAVSKSIEKEKSDNQSFRIKLKSSEAAARQRMAAAKERLEEVQQLVAQERLVLEAERQRPIYCSSCRVPVRDRNGGGTGTPLAPAHLQDSSMVMPPPAHFNRAASLPPPAENPSATRGPRAGSMMPETSPLAAATLTNGALPTLQSNTEDLSLVDQWLAGWRGDEAADKVYLDAEKNYLDILHLVNDKQ